eukprot:8324502-Heterocapsa_arctica.AAC.1
MPPQNRCGGHPVRPLGRHSGACGRRRNGSIIANRPLGCGARGGKPARNTVTARQSRGARPS